MNRWRFWVAQAVWVVAVLISSEAASAGNEGVIPLAMLFSIVLCGFLLKWGGRSENEGSMFNYNGHLIARTMATALIWITYMGGSVASVMEMSGWGVLLAFVLMIPAITFTGLIWSWERISGVRGDQLQSMAENAQKRKRGAVDGVLRDLSDADLQHLRDRLLDEQPADDYGYNRSVGDDGELVYRH